MAEQQKVKLTVSQILDDLNNGLDRKAIREKYNLTATDVARLFQHEKLKGVRVRTAPAFELEDDTTDNVPKKATPAPKKKAAATVSDAPTATAETANTVQAEEETAAVAEKPEPTGEIKEVPGSDDSAEEVDTKKGLW